VIWWPNATNVMTATPSVFVVAHNGKDRLVLAPISMTQYHIRLHPQVEAQLSAVRGLLLTASPGSVEVASAAHQAAADLLNSVPRGPHALPTSPEDAASSPQQQHQQATQHRAARRSLDYSSQQQQRSPYEGCRAPSPLGLPQLPQIPGSPGPSSARQSGGQTPRHHSAQQAAANLGQLAAMKAEVAKAMAAMVQ